MKRKTLYIITLTSLLTLSPALARKSDSGRPGGQTQRVVLKPTSRSAVSTSRTVRGSREAEPRDDRGRGTHPEAGDDRGRGAHTEPGDHRGRNRGGRNR